MVEITSTTPTFVQMDEILPGVARTSTIAQSKHPATVGDTVEPLFRIPSVKMSRLRSRQPKNESTRASDRGWNFSTMTAISPPPDGTNRTVMLAARRVQQKAGEHVKKPQLEPPACPAAASSPSGGSPQHCELLRRGCSWQTVTGWHQSTQEANARLGSSQLQAWCCKMHAPRCSRASRARSRASRRITEEAKITVFHAFRRLHRAPLQLPE